MLTIVKLIINLLLKESKMSAQRSDKLIYKGNEYELASEPLNSYLKGTGIRLVQISTACHRGYVAEWLVEDDKLF